MKKTAVIVILLVLFSVATMGQDRPKTIDVSKLTSVKDTVIKDVNHKLYIGPKGGKFIVVTSKTGSQYKKYFKAKK